MAALLARLQKSRKTKLRRLVNDALREGLRELQAPRPRQRRYRTPTVDHGRCLLQSIDNIGQVLAFAEGEEHK
ncbi:MAG: hypothetical protein U0166_15535 [Acidobacteriota bacterium]